MRLLKPFVILAIVLGSLGIGTVVSAAQDPASAPAKVGEIPLGLDAYMPVPDDNPLNLERVALGRRLFRDPILSRDGRTACGTCHDPQRSFTDNRPVSVGVFGRKGTRRVPTLVNRGYGTAFFWDGRASGLEEQVLMPIQNPNELDMALEEVVSRLKRHPDYPQLFQEAFGREANSEDLARALACYLRTVLSGSAATDLYARGDLNALSPQAQDGLRIFLSKGNCTACHLGPNFTDEHFHNTGVAWRDGKLHDIGRFAVTDKESDRGAFKTPTLREVARSAPYMHDGSLISLDEVIDFYDRGGNPNPYLDPELHPLKLTPEEKKALLAFLIALSGTVREGELK